MIALFTALALAQARPAPAPVAIDRAALQQILARPQLASRHARAWALGRVAERLWELIQDFLQARGFHEFSSGYRLAFLLSVLLAVAWLALRLLRVRTEGTKRAPEAPLRPAPEPTAEALARAAQEALTRGEGREAIRLEMLSLIASLARAGLADRRGTATNREMARDLIQRGASGPLQRQVSQLMERFDGIFYGLAAVTAQEAQDFVAGARALRDALASGRNG